MSWHESASNCYGHWHKNCNLKRVRGIDPRITEALKRGMDEKIEVEVTTEPAKSKVLSFRAPKIVQKQLADLVMNWGENATHVIHRAIAIAHQKEFGKAKRG